MGHIRMNDGAGATEQLNQDIMKECWATNFKKCRAPAIESGTFSKGKYGLGIIKNDPNKLDTGDKLTIPGDGMSSTPE